MESLDFELEEGTLKHFDWPLESGPPPHRVFHSTCSCSHESTPARDVIGVLDLLNFPPTPYRMRMLQIAKLHHVSPFTCKTSMYTCFKHAMPFQ